MPGRRKRSSQQQGSLTDYFLRARRNMSSSQRSNRSPSRTPSRGDYPSPRSRSPEHSGITRHILDDALERIYNKFVGKLQSEHRKTEERLLAEIAELGARTAQLETQYEDLLADHTALKKDYAVLQASVDQLHLTTEDLDNRNRRNNLRLRGVPESITDLREHVARFFHQILPDVSEDLFIFDRIHRALRPKPPDNSPPRDIVMCCKDFLLKEKILQAARSAGTLLFDGNTLQLFPDLSPVTLEKRRGMRSTTAVLSKNKIRYRWGFPFKLIVPHKGSFLTAVNPSEGRALLDRMGLLSSPSPPSSQRRRSRSPARSKDFRRLSPLPQRSPT